MADKKTNKLAEQRLTEFANELRKLSHPTSPVSMDLVNFVSNAIECYPAGHYKNMDQALGLTLKVGSQITKG